MVIMADVRGSKHHQPLEIGSQAVWSVSSCKSGYGVSQLRDGSTETYWQSDGQQPHFINIEFMKKMAVKSLNQPANLCNLFTSQFGDDTTLISHKRDLKIAIFTDYKQDESYTPNKISIRAGSHFHDLQQLSVTELNEPQEWVEIDVVDKDERPVRAFLFQIAVLANHQNGRDTHIRQVKIFEPETKASDQASIAALGLVTVDFETTEFRSMRICR